MASPAPSGCVSSIPKCPLLVSPCAASGGREKNLAGAGGQRSWRWVHKSRSPKRVPSAKSGQGHHALSRRQVPRERLGRDCRGGTGGWLHYVGKHQATSSIFGTLCLDLLLPFLVGVSEVGGSVDLQSFPGRV
eukprot:CAMPEP_0197512474 /NCGR_PEP_ID=MMETSP1312-20131121/73538_1 /TAXON_ID=464262 /ORGANISM="Genus nov. species nov., Strain RCC2335" /LENGTH=132 /DNA_ID=CAMNT_0043060575 /DNA_START=598 /DNA_END=995 /DNA_ORIENTATION=-